MRPTDRDQAAAAAAAAAAFSSSYGPARTTNVCVMLPPAASLSLSHLTQSGSEDSFRRAKHWWTDNKKRETSFPKHTEWE